MANTGAVTLRVCRMRGSMDDACDYGSASIKHEAPPGPNRRRVDGQPLTLARRTCLALVRWLSDEPVASAACVARSADASQRTRSGGDVAVVLAQHALDMLPLQAIDRHRVFRHQTVEVGMLRQQRGQHIIRIGGLAQVIAGTALDGFHRRGDAGVAGQDQHPHLRSSSSSRQQHQARITLHLQVEDRVIRNVLLGQRQALFGRTGDTDLQSATAHGARHYP